MPSNYIFALDIGTRSVVGIVMQETPKGLEIVATEHLEHQTRAMIDGQIHNIEQVAKVLKTVTEKLETKVGQSLTKVAVAAAGRALKTVRVKVCADIADFVEIQQDDILRLELQAVQEAQARLTEDEPDESERLLNYHCVGYSVVYYELDGFKIGSLYSQKGKMVGVEVIATFLPRVVVDSIFVALGKVGLEMTSLTLEPIAAATVVVPQGMRQLNIALVDIGAGTSDIAITAEGSIVGYGMAPVAGDEITEKISAHYLVDFNQAEIIKKSINPQEEVTFSDVLGIEHTVSKKELLDVISDSVFFLTKQISERIIELNGRTPQAVICIGGGSLTPLLKDMLAENLGLSKQRVAIRGREAISEVFGGQELVGPESVTPIGIAVASYERKGLGFAQIVVNNRQIRLFEASRGTVADALMAAGISMRKTQPRLGMALTVTVNGSLKIVKGGRGKAAIVTLNGIPVSIDHQASHNDVIEFTIAEDGENASGYIYDVVPDFLPINVNVNGEAFTINPVITMNDHPVTYYDELVDNARIVYFVPKTVAEIMEISGHAEREKEYFVYLNERMVDPMTVVEEGDDIVVEETTDIVNRLTATGSEGEKTFTDTIDESYAEKPRELETEKLALETDPRPTETLMLRRPSNTVVNVNGERVEIDRSNIILTDVLTRTEFILRPPESGMRLVMKVNGVNAEFTTPLRNGDNVTLQWE